MPSGQTLLEATLGKIIPAFEETLVVLRPGDDALAGILAQKFTTLTITIAKNAALGMGHSLAHGATMIHHWQGAAICLGDMPFHESSTLSTLRHGFRTASQPYPIIKPCHNGRAGHPVLFHRHYFAAMQALTGDEGARTLLKAHAAAVQAPSASAARAQRRPFCTVARALRSALLKEPSASSTMTCRAARTATPPVKLAPPRAALAARPALPLAPR